MVNPLETKIKKVIDHSTTFMEELLQASNSETSEDFIEHISSATYENELIYDILGSAMRVVEEMRDDD